MAANTTPIFPIAPKIGWGTLATANTAKDGTGGVATVFTAGLNGARVDRIRVLHTGTHVTTVLRVFINNGATNATATNNILFAEKSVPAVTLSETTGQEPCELILDTAIPAGYKVNCTIGASVAAALHIVCEGGDF